MCHSIKPFNFWLPILYNKIYSIPWIYDIYPTYTIDIQGILVIFYIYLRNVLKIESKWKKQYYSKKNNNQSQKIGNKRFLTLYIPIPCKTG